MPMPGCNCNACRVGREGDALGALGPDPAPIVYECSECGYEYSYAEDAETCCRETYGCPECGEQYEDEDTADSCCRSSRGSSDYPALAPLDESALYALTVPAIAGRPARQCSIEQEITEGAYRAARLMYEIGLATSDDLASYSRDCRPGQVIVKEDGSLDDDGAEIVYSRFCLDEDEDVLNMSRGLARLRELKDQCLISSGRAAGTHIHIAAVAANGEAFMPQHMTRLHELFCHLEDTLYALAACGWDEHRLSPRGDGYCKVLPKVEGRTTPAKVTRVMRSDRYYGLNFQRLYEAATRCNCGACIVGDWSACDCGTMDSATIEWRLFNSSTRPQTIHAWLLIAHALTAYATKEVRPGQPAHRLGTLQPTPIRTGTPDSRWDQLNWVLAKCPFTKDERDVIRDAARRSPGFASESY